MSPSELVRTVASDLQYLKREWDQEVDDDSLRRSSTVLRRLLIYGDDGHTWREAGFPKEPRVRATDLEAWLADSRRLHAVVRAAAGGAKYHGADIRVPILWNYVMSEEEAKRKARAWTGRDAFCIRSFKLLEISITCR